MSALHRCQTTILQLWGTRAYRTDEIAQHLADNGWPVDEAFVVYVLNHRRGRERDASKAALMHYLSIARKIDQMEVAA